MDSHGKCNIFTRGGSNLNYEGCRFLNGKSYRDVMPSFSSGIIPADAFKDEKKANVACGESVNERYEYA